MQFDIVIVGGGLAGASLAVALQGRRSRIALIESHLPVAASAGWDSRVYAIRPAARDFLDEIGVWPHLDTARISPVHDMHIHGDGDGRLDFSAYEAGVEALCWIVESGQIGRELWETVKRQANLTLFCPDRIETFDIHADAVRLRLTSGQPLEAKLLVGADGADSRVRAGAGLVADSLAYGQRGVVANFECEHPHQSAAYQWFRADGVLAWLPLPGPRLSMVWATPDALADELLALDPQALAERVAAAGGQALGRLRNITPAQAFPLRLMRVPRIVAPRLALVGDAAHGIHPLSGHGINLGFADARELAGVLGKLPDFADCGDERLLRPYARARAEETVLLQSLTHGLQRLFRPDHAALSRLRNLGLNFTNRLPVLRDMLVRHALG